MVKALVRTLIPIHEETWGEKTLGPGEYEAIASSEGTLMIHNSDGFFDLQPGQFEFIKADNELLEYWRMSVELVRAQRKYKIARANYDYYFSKHEEVKQ